MERSCCWEDRRQALSAAWERSTAHLRSKSSPNSFACPETPDTPSIFSISPLNVFGRRRRSTVDRQRSESTPDRPGNLGPWPRSRTSYYAKVPCDPMEPSSASNTRAEASIIIGSMPWAGRVCSCSTPDDDPDHHLSARSSSWSGPNFFCPCLDSTEGLRWRRCTTYSFSAHY